MDRASIQKAADKVDARLAKHRRRQQESELSGEQGGDIQYRAGLEIALDEARAALRLVLPVLEATANGKLCSIVAADLAPTIKRILDGQ